MRFALAVTAVLLAMLAADAGASRGRFFGAVIQGYPEGVKHFEFAHMGQGNVGTLRFILFWPAIQASPGPCEPGAFNPASGDPAENHCDWTAIDRLVGGAAARGTVALPFAFGSPPWVESNDGEPAAASSRVPPLETDADRDAWRAVLRAAVQRYGPDGTFWAPGGDFEAMHPGASPLPVRVWQVWNEPSTPAYFWPKPSPRRYADLLDISAEAIRAADPQARILLAGLFGTPGGGPGGIFLPRFLDRLYRVDGVEDDFDAVALHPFAPGLDGVRAQIKLARREMKQAGDGRTPIWITELGWASDGPREIQAVKSERGQARMLKRAFRMLRRRRGDCRIAGVNWYSLRDVAPKRAPCPGCPYTGLLGRDGDPKPAWRAFKRFTTG